MSGEMVWHPLQENEVIFSKEYFSKILEQIFEEFCTCIKCLLLLQYKILEKYFFENITSFSCRGYQTLSPDVRLIFPLSIMKEE